MFDRIDSEPRLPLDPDSVTPRATPFHLRPSTCVAVAAGGLLGVLLRFGFGCVFPTSEGHFPWPTCAINNDLRTAGIYMAVTILTGLLACGIGIASGARVQIRRAEEVR